MLSFSPYHTLIFFALGRASGKLESFRQLAGRLGFGSRPVRPATRRQALSSDLAADVAKLQGLPNPHVFISSISTRGFQLFLHVSRLALFMMISVVLFTVGI